MSRYYSRAGEPIDMMTWAKSFTPERQRVACTQVGDTVVSTVWLGLNYQFGDGPPLIFETMVFGGRLDQEQVRYSTEADALAGHEQLVARVKAAKEEA